jgi:predicted short-subunit dehydrogenase-like oxidoreductase (DUF2520 family)
MDDSRPRVGFIGAGRVATALAEGLSTARYPVVAVAGRSLSSAEALARRLPSCRACDSPQEVVDAAGLVFITTPDEAVHAVCESLTWREGVSVVHTSGVETREALSSAERQGAATASFHPLQTFASVDGAASKLPGTVFGVEAEGPLRERLFAIASDLGGAAITLSAEDKALYHAAAVMASNYVVTLAKLSTDLWLRLGYVRPAALQALLPLLRGAVDNLEALGLPAALTGPIARGDVETVRRHLAALSQAAPELLPTYRDLALQTLPVALAKGGLADGPARQLRSLLEAAAIESRAPHGR